MRKFLLIAMLIGAGWWYFIGGRTITEGHVVRFYQDLQAATLGRNPEAICALLADDFQSDETTEVGGRQETSTHDKEQTCAAYDELYETFEKLGNSMGGMVQLDSGYTINDIEIQPDGKSAIVDYSFSLDVAGSIMNIRSRSTDTLIRRNGRVLMLYSEGESTISAGG